MPISESSWRSELSGCPRVGSVPTLISNKNTPPAGGAFCQLRALGLELFVKLASRAGDEDAARDVALTVLDPLDDAGGFGALGTVGALGCIHYLLAVPCFCDLGH